MSAAVQVLGDKTKELVEKDWATKVKPALTQAITARGGTIWVRVNVANIVGTNLLGEEVSYVGDEWGNGSAKFHRLTNDSIESQRFVPVFGQSILSYIQTKEHNSKEANAQSQRPYEMGLMHGSGARVRMIDVFSQAEYVDQVNSILEAPTYTSA